MDVFGNTPRSSSDFEDFHFRLAKRNLDWSSRKSCFSGCCAPPYIYYGLKILPENWAFSLHYIPNVYNTQKRLGSVGPCLATLASLAREDIRSRMREQLFSPVFHLSLIIAHTHSAPPTTATKQGCCCCCNSRAHKASLWLIAVIYQSAIFPFRKWNQAIISITKIFPLHCHYTVVFDGM